MREIADRQLHQFYSRYAEKAARSETYPVLDAQELADLLAAVADRPGLSRFLARILLARPGITEEERLAFTRKGMDATEREDLLNILDGGYVDMTDTVRRFLNKLVGRDAGEEPVPHLEVSGNQAQQTIAGTASPGATIEAVNLSAIASTRFYRTDTFELATADAHGRFNGSVRGLEEGDWVRLRARSTTGAVSHWLTLRATGLAAADTRNTEVNLARMGLRDRGDGWVEVKNIDPSRLVAEPGARLLFRNIRTQQETRLTLDDHGGFPEGACLAGRAGDTWSVHASDGVNNTDFLETCGTVTASGTSGPAANPPLPAPLKADCNPDGSHGFGTCQFTGPLFAGTPDIHGAHQGFLGDCYLVSAVGALAQHRPRLLQDIIRDNGNGTYTVTFKELDDKGTCTEVPITVDGHLYVNARGTPLYGFSSGPLAPDRMELWFPLLEKAYATWKGGYDAMGNGGLACDALEALTGQRGIYVQLDGTLSDAQVWHELQEITRLRLPVVSSTNGETAEAQFTNSGLYSWHAYVVVGCHEQDGKKYVTVRNPWGEPDPFHQGCMEDGFIQMELHQFTRNFCNLMTVGG